MKDKPFVAGVVIGALAVGLILLLTGGWGGMMGPGWNYGMMGPWMIPVGWLLILAAFLAALVIWVARNQKK